MANESQTTLPRRRKRADVVPFSPSAPKDSVISVRVPLDLKNRMEGLRFGPYPVRVTDLVIRGIELAIDEIERTNKSRSAETHG